MEKQGGGGGEEGEVAMRVGSSPSLHPITSSFGNPAPQVASLGILSGATWVLVRRVSANRSASDSLCFLATVGEIEGDPALPLRR